MDEVKIKENKQSVKNMRKAKNKMRKRNCEKQPSQSIV